MKGTNVNSIVCLRHPVKTELSPNQEKCPTCNHIENKKKSQNKQVDDFNRLIKGSSSEPTIDFDPSAI